MLVSGYLRKLPLRVFPDILYLKDIIKNRKRLVSPWVQALVNAKEWIEKQ